MINVVFFGTPAIALKSLEYLYNSEKINVLAVVTQPDKPAGRGHKMSMSVLKQFALEHNLPVLQPKSIRKEAPPAPRRSAGPCGSSTRPRTPECGPSSAA